MHSTEKNIDFFELKIQGSVGKEILSRKNFDIGQLIELLEDAVDLTRKPLGKELSKENITLNYEDGCIRLIIYTSLTVINSLFADLTQANKTNNLFDIEKSRASVISKWQEKAKADNTFSFSINDSSNKCKIKIDSNSEFIIPPPKFIENEIILYGEITDMGGKKNPNIHIDTEYGSMTISCSKEDIKNENRLYTVCGIRAKAKQDLTTFEISKEEMRFLEFIEYKGKLEGNELLKFIDNGTEAWKEINDSVKWQRNIRGHED